MSADFDKLREIFLAVLEQAPEQRNAYLDQVCAGDEELRRNVAVMLKAQAAGEGPLDRAVLGDECAGAYEQVTEAPGTMIGAYKLLEQIGEGGFGMVYMAEQQQPVRRRVALKILKPGMDTRQVVARFEAERQALAIMDHPNIAKVFDGGVTGVRNQESGVRNQGSPAVALTPDPCLPTPGAGRPYFVMELVKGVPITESCDQNHLTPRQRLELFVPVCQAVQHAHQKGIIHRDLKPSNILVVMHDTTPVPKVIDFGIAKALGQELTDKTLFTAFTQMIGTPLYMSPEQAGQSGLDIDTRSDIYSLGVLLYELLTGTTPFTKERFKQAGYDEVRRIICEEEPPKPSTRLAHSTETLASISANRQMEPAKLTKLVRGELDWIVMKALEKDRSRRYETANALALDVQRYLADEPVLACPPSAGYRLRKFARRNKAGLTVAALVLFFLVLLGSGVALNMRDRTARHAKVAGKVEGIFAEVDRLEHEQKWAEALAAARQAAAAATGGEADAPTVERVRELLKGLEFIDRLEKIRMKKTTFAGGDFDHAGTDREYAQAFRDYGVDIDELATEMSIDRLKSRQALAPPLAAALDEWVFVRFVISEKDAPRWKRLVAVARGVDPEPLRDRLRSCWGQSVSDVRDELRRLADSIEIRAHHPTTLHNLALTLQRLDQADAALRLLRGARHFYPGDFWLNFELALALHRQKDYEGSIRFNTAAVSIIPNSAAAHNNLGLALAEQKKLDEAIASYRKAIELEPSDAIAYSNLAIALHAQKKLDEAIAEYETARRLNPDRHVTLFYLGRALGEQGNWDLALPHFQQAAAIMEKRRFQHEHAATIVNELIRCHERLKQFDKAEAWQRKLLAVVKARAGVDSLPYAAELAALGWIMLQRSMWTDAEPVLRECLRLREQMAPDTWLKFEAAAMLGAALLGQRKHADAEPLLIEGYHGMKVRQQTVSPKRRTRISEAAICLAQLYDATDKKDDAAKWRDVFEQHEGVRVGSVHDVGDGLELHGTLDARTSTLVYEVKLTVGKTYLIDMVSMNQKALDPYLMLKDADRQHLADDDDSGGGLNARLTYRAPRDGVYRIHATFYRFGRGAFTVTVREK